MNTMSTNETVGEWLARLETEKAQAVAAAQAEAQRQAEAARLAAVPQSAQQRAFVEAAKLYDSILAQEAAKTAADREAETLRAEQGQLAARHESLAGNPGQNWTEMQAAANRLSEIEARLQKIGAVTPDRPVQMGPRTMYIMPDGSILPGDAQLTEG
jgi:hypothetical protein